MKVLFQSRKTLYTVPGGDTTQILKTKAYLERLGVEVDVSLELEPDLTGYDIVHVFNLTRPQELYLQVRNAKRQGKKVALSTIYVRYDDYEKHARGGVLQWLNNHLSPTTTEYLKVIARALLNREMSRGTAYYLCHGHKRLQRKIIEMVDVFLPNSHAEMRQVAKDFGLHHYNYVAVVNAVDVHSFDYEATIVSPEVEQYRDCILCVSRIEGLKNHLNVIRACKDLPYKLVFIGKPGANFQRYYEQCRKEAGGNVYFLGQIPHEQLPQFYKVAKVHILASWMETTGLSSLEAGVMRTNVVVTKKGYTEEYFQHFAYYCEPDDVESIRRAVVAAYEAPFDEAFLTQILNHYTWEDTARQTLQGYQSIL